MLCCHLAPQPRDAQRHVGLQGRVLPPWELEEKSGIRTRSGSHPSKKLSMVVIMTPAVSMN